MRALELTKPGSFKWLNKEKPGLPKAGEVLLKTKHISICGTDLHAYKGNQPFFSYPRILGHEIAAEVLETGEGVNHVKKGDIVSVEPYRNPVVDQAVNRGKTNCGSKLTVLGVHEDGAMQDEFIYLASNVHLANGMNVDDIAMIEPFAIGSHAVERANLQHDDTVLVIGVGPIGLAVIAMARLHGIKIAALDTNENRLKFAKQKFPEIETLLLKDSIANELEDVFGHLPTVIFDATGNKSSMQNSFNLAASGATIVFVGLFVGEVVFDDPTFHRKEINLKASRSARARDFKKVMNLMRAGLIDTSGYITHRIPFDSMIDEYEKLYDPKENVVKAIIDFY
jgi:2-desacetyl-2-hydroxyethyl bacteriochlorophyllide A dehydrogenase